MPEETVSNPPSLEMDAIKSLQDQVRSLSGRLSAPQGVQETPQEELRRLLIEVSAIWDQGLTLTGRELLEDQRIVDEWENDLSELQRKSNLS